jgi:hypothetical protein
MSELKNALRAGDVSVVGSRQFKDFDDYLMTRTEFNQRYEADELGVAVATSARDYLEECFSQLREALDRTNTLATRGEIPDVELTESGLKISPLDSDVPDEAEALKLR